MRKILPLFFLFCFAAGSVPALAAPDAAGAAALKKSVEDTLAWYSEIADAAGQGLEAKGAVEVMPGDKYYAIRIPGVTALSGNGYRLDIGDLLLNAKPGDTDGEWLLSTALPPTMTAYDAAGTPVADITLGSQQLSAAWVPALDFFPRYELDYKDIAVKPRAGTPFSMTVKELTARQNLVRQADGTFTGPSIYTTDHLGITFTGNDQTSMKLDKIESHGTTEKMSLDGRKEMKEKVRLLISKAQGAHKQDELRAGIIDIINTSASLPDNFTTGIDFEGFSLEARKAQAAPTADNAKDAVQLGFDRIAGEIALHGLKQDRGDASLKGALGGLKVSGLPGSLAGIVPYVGNIDLRADNVPMKQLSQAFMSILSSASGKLQDEAEHMKASKQIQGVLMAMPQQLAGAGMAVTIKDTYLRATDLTVALQAQFTANAASPLVAVGSLTFALGGIDELVQKYQAMSASPQAMTYVQMMTPLQMMGKPDKGPDGKSRRTYKIDLTPDGKMLLNGLDMAMAQKMMGAAASALQPDTVKQK